ncbi:hypothetical protein BCR34DRAFT_585778 [Clohesyomyces aquaticus]|uniref:Uncharacterized protein n=1 Tax=Clohesyomyces aquaticus TaxID=1231657 RepID=A0A1Y1ZVX7_9PLEO|nr:hypothetical protein BCR34DRAFT_585778 [Clohesyomyces aquaticus]
MSSQSNDIAPHSATNYSWSQILPSLNGLYDAQLDESFDTEEPITTVPGSNSSSSAPAVTASQGFRQGAPARLSRPSETTTQPENEAQPTALYSWSQLWSANELDEEEDYDTRFAAEEEELMRAGIIKEIQPVSHKRLNYTNTLVSTIQSTTNPSECVAAQIAWNSSREDATTNPLFGNFNEYLNTTSQEAGFAERVRQANTPAACVAAQISWSEARAQGREATGVEQYRANHSWSQVLPSLSSAA